MALQLTPVVVAHAAIAVVLAGITIRSAGRREVTGARSLSALTFTIALWVGATAGYLARTDFAGKRLFSNISFFAIATLPVVYLYFAAEYGNRDLSVTRYGPLPLVVVPAITQVLIWTNPLHGLMWSVRRLDPSGGTGTIHAVPGVWYWVHATYSYALIVLATLLLVRMLVVSDHVYRGQAAAILVGAFTPVLANVAFHARIVAFPFDPTPIAFSVTAVAFITAIYRHRILEIVPVAREIARDELMDELAEAVFILDDRGFVVDCNARAEALVPGDDDPVVGRPLEALLPALAETGVASPATDGPGTDRYAKAEIALGRDGTRRYYDVRARALRRGGGLLCGTLLSLRDVTERRQREQRLDVLNRTLRHDLRNEATVIVGHAELGLYDNPHAEWLSAIIEHVEGLVDMGEKVRQLEQALDDDPAASHPVDVAAVVRDCVASLEADRPVVDVETALPDSVYVSALERIDWAIENALENAVDHNDNPVPHVRVTVSKSGNDGNVTVTIADDGPGIDEAERAVLQSGFETQLEHVSGLGLWGIHWIVTESGGTVEISDNEPRGTVVTLHLPAADPPPADPDAATEGQRSLTDD